MEPVQLLRWIIETIASAFMQVIIIVAAFARAASALTDYKPCYQLQKHRKQTHTQTALNVKPFQARAPCAKTDAALLILIVMHQSLAVAIVRFNPIKNMNPVHSLRD